MARIFHQRLQEIEFGGRQLDRLAGELDFVPIGIQQQLADLNDMRRPEVLIGPTQHGAHARDHFVRIERLGDVIIGAEVQTP